jgi:hypothetical protein
VFRRGQWTGRDGITLGEVSYRGHYTISDVDLESWSLGENLAVKIEISHWSLDGISRREGMLLPQVKYVSFTRVV